MKSNIQRKYSNYVAFSNFHGRAVNNLGLLKWQYQTQDKDLKPDFMPERMDGYCDIMEFKMPHLDGKCIVGVRSTEQSVGIKVGGF